MAVRFPYFKPLLDVVEFLLLKGVPPEWWIKDCAQKSGCAQEGDAQCGQLGRSLQDAIARLEECIVVQFESAEGPGHLEVVWSLFEEWAMAQRSIPLNNHVNDG